MANSGYYTEPKLNATGGGGSSLTIREADGTPSGVVTELVFPNDTISIASGVGTLTLVGDADSRLGVVYDTAEGLPVLSVLDTTWSFLNNTYRGNFRTAIDAAASSHTHGNISNAGAIGTTADLPISTTASGVINTRTVADFRALLGLAATNSPTFAGVTIANDGDTYLTVNATTGSGQIAGIRLQRGTTGDAFTDWIVEANAGNLLLNRSSGGVVSTPVAFTDAASNIITIASDRAYGWSNSTTAGVASDLLLFRGGAGVLFQRNATNGQISRIAKTFTSSSNFEALDIDAASDASNYRIGSRIGSAGGTTRGLQLGSYNAAGAWTSWLALDTSGNMTLPAGSTISNVNFTTATSGSFRWNNRTRLLCGLDGLMYMTNSADSAAVNFDLVTSSDLTLWANFSRTTLKALAFGDLTITPSSSRTLSTNGQFSIEMTSDTEGNLVYRGSDGTTRRMALTFS